MFEMSRKLFKSKIQPTEFPGTSWNQQFHHHHSGSDEANDTELERNVQHMMYLDCFWSRKLSIYSGNYESSTFNRVRTFLKLLEFSGHGVPWLAIVLLLAFVLNGIRQEFFLNLFLALLLDLIVTALLKLAVKRPRPQYNENDMKFTLKIDDYAFPSGHTTRAFMVFVLFCFYDLSVIMKVVILSWAITLGVSRVMLGRHHISDVLFGLLIGIAEAAAVLNMWWHIS